MKTLKKAISLTLCLAMCMAFIVVPTFAATCSVCNGDGTVVCDGDGCVEVSHWTGPTHTGGINPCTTCGGTGTVSDGGGGEFSEIDGVLSIQGTVANGVSVVAGDYFSLPTFNLSGEKLNPAAEKAAGSLDTKPEFAFKGWSVDNGAKWSNKPLTDKNIVALLNKGGTLILTDKLDSKGKAPVAGAAVKVKALTAAALNDITATTDFGTAAGKITPVTAGTTIDTIVAWITANDVEAAKGDLFGIAGNDVVMDGTTVDTPATHVVWEVTDEAVIPSLKLTFPAVQARKRDTKMAVNYLEYADFTFATNGAWTLLPKGGTFNAAHVTALESLEICRPADGKKFDPAKDEYVAYLEDTNGLSGADKVDYEDYGSPLEGVTIKNLGKDGKVVKTTYFVRTAAGETGSGATYKLIPATKGYKVTATSTNKAPGAKPNYKTNDIKPKAGQAINGVFLSTNATTTANGWTLFGKSAATAKTNSVTGNTIPAVLGMPDKDKMPSLPKGTVGAAPGTSGAAYIEVATVATEKKAASVVLTIDIAPPAAVPTAGDFAVDAKGKWTTFDGAKFEAKLTTPADAKFGKGPKLTVPTAATPAETLFVARAKAVAKPVKAAYNEDRGKWVVGFTEGSVTTSAEVNLAVKWNFTAAVTTAGSEAPAKVEPEIIAKS